MSSNIPVKLLLPLIFCGLTIATIGYFDDKNHIPAKFRLIAHFVIAGIGAISLLFASDIHLTSLETITILLLSMFYIVWSLNLFNFMDGINGIAVIEGFSVLVGAAIIDFLYFESTLAIVCLILAVSILGFGFWNFPAAKMFMGDVGSGFLGITISLLSLNAATISTNYFFAWIILFAVFISDSTVTLIRRALFKQRIFDAHRTHAYQYAARKLQSHTKVSISVAVINLFWLFPLAMLVSSGQIDTLIAIALAYLPLILLALSFSAGKPESTH